MKKQFVQDLQEGDIVNDYFVAVRKDLRDTQTGGKFLGLVFKDRTGEVGGVLWNNAQAISSLFELGDVVNVRGTVNSYQNRLQVRVDQVLPLKEDEYDTRDLVFVGGGGPEIMGKFTEALRTVKNPWLKKLIDAFLSDAEFVERFTKAAAGKRWHHAYQGGLVQHCYEMTRVAEVMCELFPNIDRDLLLAGILVHDVGKLEELRHDLFVDYTTAGKLVGHLQLGCIMVDQKIQQIEGFPESLKLQLFHLILSHHGEHQFGSPVVPKTVEAVVLYLIDNLDAQADAYTRVVDEAKSKRQEWSDYINLIDRQIWTKDM